MNMIEKTGFIFITALLISEPSLARQSGYDLSGYRFTDSTEEAGPIYEYNDISISGTELILENHELADLVFPFEFNFYKEVYSQIFINPFGTVVFLNGLDFSERYVENNYYRAGIPIDYDNASSIQAPFIAPFYTNFDLENLSIFTKVQSLTNSTTDESTEQFIIQYQFQYSDDDIIFPGVIDYQVILNAADDSILFQYKNTQNNARGHLGDRATVGIQSTETSGIGYSVSEPIIHNDLAILFERADKYIGTDKVTGSLQVGAPDEMLRHSIRFINATGARATFAINTTESVWQKQLPYSEITLDNDAEITIDVDVKIDNRAILDRLNDQFTLSLTSGEYRAEVDIVTRTSFSQRLSNFDNDHEIEYENGYIYLLGLLSSDATQLVVSNFTDASGTYANEIIAIDTDNKTETVVSEYSRFSKSNIAFAEDINSVFFMAKSDILMNDDSSPAGSGVNTIYRIGLNDTQATALLSLSSPEAQQSYSDSYLNIATSSDGSVVAFLSKDDWSGENSYNVIELFIANINENGNTSVRQITAFNDETDTYNNYSGDEIALSFDGSTLIFLHEDNILNEANEHYVGNDTLYIIDDIESAEIRRLTPFSYDVESIDISADGEKIVFISTVKDGINDGIDQIFTIDRDGSKLQALTANQQDYDYDYVSLSGDGRVIAVEADSDLMQAKAPITVEEVYVMAFDGSNLNQVTVSGGTRSNDLESGYPDLSYDGRWLLFKSDAKIIDNNDSKKNQFYLLDLNESLPEFIDYINAEPEPVIESMPKTETPEVSKNSSCSLKPYCDTSGSMNPYGLAIMLLLLLLRLRRKPSELKNEIESQTQNTPYKPQHWLAIAIIIVSPLHGQNQLKPT